jgi:hypothetical protein
MYARCTKECVNICAVNTFPVITTGFTPVKEIKELSFSAPTRIGIDLRIVVARIVVATALLSLL